MQYLGKLLYFYSCLSLFYTPYTYIVYIFNTIIYLPSLLFLTRNLMHGLSFANLHQKFAAHPAIFSTVTSAPYYIFSFPPFLLNKNCPLFARRNDSTETSASNGSSCLKLRASLNRRPRRLSCIHPKPHFPTPSALPLPSPHSSTTASVLFFSLSLSVFLAE